jgi:hypothetical protein
VIDSAAITRVPSRDVLGEPLLQAEASLANAAVSIHGSL